MLCRHACVQGRDDHGLNLGNTGPRGPSDLPTPQPPMCWGSTILVSHPGSVHTYTNWCGKKHLSGPEAGSLPTPTSDLYSPGKGEGAHSIMTIAAVVATWTLDQR